MGRSRHKTRGSPRRSPFRLFGSEERRSPSRRRAASRSASRSRRRSVSRPKRRRRRRRAASRSSSSHGSADGEAPNRIYVPHGDCARIIGRKGETRIDIERQSEASIRVQREEDTDGNKKERFIELMGTPKARKAALQLIMKLASFVRDDDGKVLKDGPGQQHASSNNGAVGAPPDEVLHIRTDEVRKILGRGGETIKSIEDGSGARLELERDVGKIEIRGSHEAVQRAIDLVIAEVSYARSADGRVLKGADDGRAPPPDRGAGGGGACASGPPLLLWVSSKEAGRVIGRGGETVREMMQKSGADVKVQRSDDADAGASEREIQVFGTAGQKEEVYFAIAREVTYLRGESGVIKAPEMAPHEAEDAVYSRAPFKISSARAGERPAHPPVPGGPPGMPPPGMMPGMMMPPGMTGPGMMPPPGVPPGGGPPGEGWPMMPPMGAPGMFPPGMMGPYGPPGMGPPQGPGSGAKSDDESSSSSSESSSAKRKKKKKKALKKQLQQQMNPFMAGMAAMQQVQGAYGVPYQPAWGAQGNVAGASQKKLAMREALSASLKDVDMDEL